MVAAEQQPAESGGGSGGGWRRKSVAIAAAFVVFVFVVVVAAAAIVGFDNRHAPTSLPSLDESDLPPSLRNRLVDLHARVSSALTGRLGHAP